MMQIRPDLQHQIAPKLPVSNKDFTTFRGKKMLLNTRSSNHQLLLFLVQILTMAVIRDLTYSMPVRVQPALVVVAGVVALGPDLDHGGDTGPYGLLVRVLPHLEQRFTAHRLGPTWNRCSLRIRTRRDNAAAVKYAIIEICTHS